MKTITTIGKLKNKPLLLRLGYAFVPSIVSRRADGIVSYAKHDDPNWWKNAKSIYEFSANDIDGNEVSLDKYRGHVCVIVNVSTKCGLTDSNYKQLQALHEEFAESHGLRILGFPCNQFASQEPGTNAEIKTFATEKYGVKFDMFAKINVNGDDAHPLYKYMKDQKGGFLGSFIKWNFTKFLIDKEGQVAKRFGPKDDPFTVKKDLPKYW